MINEFKSDKIMKTKVKIKKITPKIKPIKLNFLPLIENEFFSSFSITNPKIPKTAPERGFRKAKIILEIPKKYLPTPKNSLFSI